MIIIISQATEPKPFKVSEAMYRSEDWFSIVRVEDFLDGNEITLTKIFEGMKFYLWKYKYWNDKWEYYEKRN